MKKATKTIEVYQYDCPGCGKAMESRTEKANLCRKCVKAKQEKEYEIEKKRREKKADKVRAHYIGAKVVDVVVDKYYASDIESVTIEKDGVRYSVKAERWSDDNELEIEVLEE